MEAISLISRFLVAAVLFPLACSCFFSYLILYFPAPLILKFRAFFANLAAKKMIYNPKLGERRWQFAIILVRVFVALLLVGALGLYCYQLHLFMSGWLAFGGDMYWFWYAGAVLFPMLPGYFLFRYILRHPFKSVRTVKDF